MTPKQANQELLKVINTHLQMLQGGKFGTPTTDDLQFCRELHILLEKLTKPS